VVPERLLDRVRTYGDLVRATGLLIRARRAAEVRAAEPPLRMWARVLRPAGESGGSLERAGWLTPYAAETIAKDALRAGQGARLELTVAASTDEVGLTGVQHQFTWLGERDDRRPSPPARCDTANRLRRLTTMIRALGPWRLAPVA